MDYRVLFAAPLAALVMSVSAMDLSLPSPWTPLSMGLPGPGVKLMPERVNFAVATQWAQGYAGKRLRFSGQIRSEGVSTWAGLFMDEDPTHTTLISLQGGLEGGENTLPLRGAAGQAPYKAWQDVSVVVQLPTTSDSVALGLALVGEGQVWARKLRFEVVGPEVPLTSTRMLGFDWAKARDERVRLDKKMSQMSPLPLINSSFD